jgi:hypothetical protein
MNDEERTCLICLEGPLEENPIHLLQCGCRTSWFHSSCETTWIQHLQLENLPSECPTCPTCRRDIEIRFQYSFFFQNGTNQKYFWWVMSLIGADIFMAFVLSLNGYYQAFYLPSHSFFILAIPYISPSRYNLLYFLHHVRCRYLVFAGSWFVHVFKYKNMYALYPDNTLNVLLFLSSLHIITLVCQEIHNYFSYDHYRIDPNGSFITGYMCVHSQTLFFRKSPPIPLEGDKLPLRRSSRIHS